MKRKRYMLMDVDARSGRVLFGYHVNCVVIGGGRYYAGCDTKMLDVTNGSNT